METEKEKYILALKDAFNSYAKLSEKSWSLIREIIRFQAVKKGETILRAGQTAKDIHFICRGILRTFAADGQGNIYTKNIFLEHSFPASKVSLLLQAPSYIAIDALEDSVLINFNFMAYKQLMDENEDIKSFYIAYIERNWIIEKEQREISIVMENASERYLKLLEKHPLLDKRIAQHHIASHLGITPTQLSRIRKALKK
ncbi:cyclic nucleotide-binding protein [Reichenbachiella sp. 5M10]|uniref:Crp/Fnr family transcriptional regulator n=1 Tax=Reichenbachiella sp. 5M10 TaxID=1889772 RepID=UPI000C15318C|nr:Crp/Fnr family transcriptional regulator [Reichenbachiella sp. 5M10]PIB34719.1 cyclic nucleotide-binding protein [Reichenbachiella sp. 5M10]